jgi:hypothetical protein
MRTLVRVFLISALVHSAHAGVPDCATRSGTALSVTRNATARDLKALTINDLNCNVQNDGIVGSDTVFPGIGFWYPGGQKEKSLLLSAGFWVTGQVGVDVRTAATMYSTEFQPGRILDDGSADDPAKPEYRVYKYTVGQAVDAEAIAQGCPPDVIGDQMVFSVFNDLTDHAMVFNKLPIGLEVRLTGWGYHRFHEPSALGQALFFRIRIANRGGNTLEDAFTAMFLDADIGKATDDAAGCDSTLGLAFAYNGDPVDDVYGTRIPALGCVLLQGPIADSPGDTVRLTDGTVLADQKALGITSFATWMCGAPVPGMTGPTLQDAQGAMEAYFYMRGLKANGEPWQDPGHGNRVTKFPFGGDPVAGTGWLSYEYAGCHDVYLLLSSGPFTLAPGESQEIVFALVVGLGNDNLNSVTALKANTRAVRQFYTEHFGLSSVVSGKESGPSGFGLLQNFPNPFNPTTTIRFAVSKPGRVRLALFDAAGRKVAGLADGTYREGEHRVLFDAGSLPSGVYMYRMEAGGRVESMKMVLLE